MVLVTLVPMFAPIMIGIAYFTETSTATHELKGIHLKHCEPLKPEHSCRREAVQHGLLDSGEFCHLHSCWESLPALPNRFFHAFEPITNKINASFG